MVTSHVSAMPAAMHAPPQPRNAEPVPATAVSVTIVPVVKVLMQSAVQSMPPTLLTGLTV